MSKTTTHPPTTIRDEQYHHGDLRRALMQVALEALSGPEPHVLSFRDLARKLGVTTAAPYHHFKDRSELLVTLATEGFHLLFDSLSNAAAQGDTYPQKSTELTLAYLHFARTQVGYYRAMFLPEVRAAADAKPEFKSAANLGFNLVCNVIAEANPEFSAPQVSERAVSLWSLLHGMIVLSSSGILKRRLSHQHEDRVAVEAVLRLLNTDPLPSTS
ncbi:TetR family transcriptional regulator [Granulicella sp. 5B5]|uniref:TetR/AcrR family transcriptional regulator n=1 Tax=Granulicella sp. 5B5 TaxID=1617967 RepID=UPI0015F66495|nr:TetR/AcrR family transcriptional regulator [Granulicella sp. 5B5]QMV19946.1 TetR family transcriptional regulator [Granulicella sp. 5B5]